MYSLPITTYSDYWRRTKKWSSYLGGVAVFAAGTRYSTMGIQDSSQSIQMVSQQASHSLGPGQLNIIEFTDFQGQTFNQGSSTKRSSSERMVSRGFSAPSQTAQENSKEDKPPTASIRILEQKIPFETEYVESNDLPPGMKQTSEKGEEGVLRQVVKTFEVDGQPVDQQVLLSHELKSSKKEVIIQNSLPTLKKIMVQTPKPGKTTSVKEQVDLKNLKISKTLNVEASAYTYTGNKTATGIVPREGLIAVDPNVIAMGTKVYVEGYGYAIAADTGGAIHGNRIDVFFDTLRECLDWGRKPVRIHIINTI